MNVNGKVSWFGGPGDPTDSGHTANGETTKTPGIAVYNHGTLNGYWRVSAPNGKTVILKQTDIGPAPFTGRKIDVTYSALGKFGYGEHNFPTDSEFKAEYLGRNQPKGQAVESAPKAAMSVPKALPGVTPTSTQGFDQAGFEKAQKASVLGKLIASEPGSKENPLLTTGVVTTKAPQRSEFTTEGTAAPKLPGAPQATPPQQAQAPGVSTKLGGFLPGNAELQIKRVDQGQDFKTNSGGAIIAPGDGEVVAIKSDPNGFGPDYAVIKMRSGPLAGKAIYLGHAHAVLKQGDQFKTGQVLARTGTHGVGNASEPGWGEIGFASALGTGNMQAGNAIAPYLTRKK